MLDYAVPLEHNESIMNKLTTQKRAQIVSALVEGNSLRATSRMTGASKVTILRLLEALGPACAEYQDKAIRNVTCKRIQCDEIWQFCYAKDKNVPAEKRGTFGYGDVWTWVAIDPDTKLVLSGPSPETRCCARDRDLHRIVQPVQARRAWRSSTCCSRATCAAAWHHRADHLSGRDRRAAPGALAAARFARHVGTGPAIWISEAATGPLAFVAPFVRHDWTLVLLAVAMAGVSFGIVVYNITQVSFRQGLCPPTMLGRMNATMRFLVWGTMPAGSLLGGVLGTAIGVRETLSSRPPEAR